MAHLTKQTTRKGGGRDGRKKIKCVIVNKSDRNPVCWVALFGILGAMSCTA